MAVKKPTTTAQTQVAPPAPDAPNPPKGGSSTAPPASRRGDEIAHALASPFDPQEVKFKPQAVSGNRALAIPYVDARVIQDRLDDVLGVLNWQDTYDCLPDGAVVCHLKIRLEGEWISKVDVGSPSEQPDEGDRRKAAFSDALKRAAVKFGIGRYLYRQKPQWCDYDPQKRQFARTPSLPQPAVSQPARTVAMPAAPAPAKPIGNNALDRVLTFQGKLILAGLCEDGELLDALEDSLGQAWVTAPQADIEKACRAFEQGRKAAQQMADQRA